MRRIEIADMEENRLHGFARPWEVFPDYEIREGKILPKKPFGVPRFYGPLAHDELPNALASLRSANENEILRFVRTYGLLGFQQLAAGEHPDKPPPLGDPIPLIIAHAQTVHLVLQLLEFISFNDLIEEAPNCLIERKPIEYAAGLKRRRQDFLLGSVKQGSPLLARARHIARVIINANFFSVQPKLYEGKESLHLFLSYSALIETVYYQLATSAANGRIQRCASASCGGFFIQRDLRQRYCPPWFGQGESRCSLRERQRAWQKRKPKN